MAVKLLGFAKQVVVAGVFGANIDTDLFFLAERFLNNINFIISQVILAAFVPVYLEVKKQSDSEALQFTSDSVRFFSVFTALVALLVVLFSSLIAGIIAPSYSAYLTERLSFYLRIFAPMTILFMLQSVFHALLNANKKFVPGQMTGLIQSVVIIGFSLVLGNTFGVKTLVFGFFVYSILNFLFLGFFSYKDKLFKLKDFHFSQHMKKLLFMVLPLLGGYMFTFVNQQVNKMIVSGMDPGSFSAMNYGFVLSNFVSSLIMAVCTVIYTEISGKIVDGRRGEASAVVIRTISILVSFFIPVTVISFLFSNEIAAIVFERGAFDRAATLKTSKALAGYAFLFVPFVINSMLSQLHYAYGNTKSPMINTVSGILFNILFSFLLYRKLGLFGVTLASSIGIFISSVLNIISACRMKYIDRFQSVTRLVPVWSLGLATAVVTSCMCARLFSEMSVFLRFGLISCVVMAASFGVTAPFVFKKFDQEAI